MTGWLTDLGLGDYAEAFEANGVDTDLLPELTNEDLKDLGVARLADRKKLLKAIAELPPGAVGQATEPAASRSETAADRRQLTVMFVDVVGSTALSGELDPEDYREVLRAYQNACAGVVARYEGHVAKLLGDGTLVYFGYPQAHEDDAERAVRAGLDVVEAVSALKLMTGVSLRVRVGIATGLVVVGDTVGEGVTEKGAISGATPNLAARLQALAQPDWVVIAESTHRLLGAVFESEDLGDRALKGVAEPVRVRRVVKERAAASRFEAVHVGRLTPFIGREQEIALLLDRWAQAKQGEGQVVQLSSEAGIGKSRMASVLLERVSTEPHVRLRYQCSPHHVNSALYPFIAQLERAAGLAQADRSDIKLDKLEALFGQGTDDIAAAVPLVAALLSVPTGDRYPPLELEPQRQKQFTLEALLDQLAGLAARKPVLVAFEDAHWADPTTLELLEAMVDRIRDLRVIAVITHRPEFRAPWAGRAHVTSLVLKPLPRKHSEEMIANLTMGKSLPESVFEQIVAKTDGMPLFIEELTKDVLESDLLVDAGDRYELSGPLPPLAIPSTLQDSLMARLDRSAPVKEVAQIGAAIGREFSHELLAAVSHLSDNRLAHALEQLTGFELVFRRGIAPGATYVFKHALVQDTAYESLLKSKRQELHRRIAQVLERDFPESSETEPEILAHHFAEANLSEAAIEYWHRAGRRAVERSSNAEAIAHLNKGIALLDTLPASPERVRTEIALQTVLGVALGQAEGGSSPNVHRTYSRMRELCEQAGDTSGLYAATWGLWYNKQYSVQFEAARDLSEELLALSRGQEDTGLVLQAHHAAWTTNLTRGAVVSALEHAEHGQRLYDIHEHGSHAFRFGGHDPGVCSLCIGSWSRWLLGYPDQALRCAHDARSLGEELSHPYSLGVAIGFASLVFQLCGRLEQASEWAAGTHSLAGQHGYLGTTWNALAKLTRAWVLTRRSKPQEAHALVRESLQAQKNPMFRPYYLGNLSEICLHSGEPERGLEAIAEGLTIVARTDERWWEAELHRLRGELLRASRAQASKVEASFRLALKIARRQEARSLELRAATSLTRFWRDQGRTDEARDLLAPVCGWFTEGFETSDLKEAEALLDKLS
ncbi:MAG: adenylate/guanylate cyclase domain-containing protein [Kiloniellales bacterium]